MVGVPVVHRESTDCWGGGRNRSADVFHNAVLISVSELHTLWRFDEYLFPFFLCPRPPWVLDWIICKNSVEKFHGKCYGGRWTGWSFMNSMWNFVFTEISGQSDHVVGLEFQLVHLGFLDFNFHPLICGKKCSVNQQTDLPLWLSM